MLCREAEAKCKRGEVGDSETHSPRENMKEKGNEGNPEKRQHIKKRRRKTKESRWQKLIKNIIWSQRFEEREQE